MRHVSVYFAALLPGRSSLRIQDELPARRQDRFGDQGAVGGLFGIRQVPHLGPRDVLWLVAIHPRRWCFVLRLDERPTKQHQRGPGGHFETRHQIPECAFDHALCRNVFPMEDDEVFHEPRAHPTPEVSDHPDQRRGVWRARRLRARHRLEDVGPIDGRTFLSGLASSAVHLWVQSPLSPRWMHEWFIRPC